MSCADAAVALPQMLTIHIAGGDDGHALLLGLQVQSYSESKLAPLDAHLIVVDSNQRQYFQCLIAKALFAAASAPLEALARAPMVCSLGISFSESMSPSDSVEASEDESSSSK